MVGRAPVLALLLVLCLFASSALGWEGQVALHVGGSLTRAQYESGYYDGDSKFGPGVLFGFTSVVPLGSGNGLAFETGLLFNQRGGETDFHIVRSAPDEVVLWERTDTYDWRLWYATFPMALRYSPSEEGGVYLKAGMELAFLLEARREWPVYDHESDEEPDVDYVVRYGHGDFNFYDFSVLAGVGYEFSVAGSNGFVELTYVQGLRDVLNVRNAVFDAKLTNSSINLSVGVLVDYDF
jgi:hypothetical protein